MRVLAALALACAPAFAQQPGAVSPEALARIVEARLAESETPACIAVGIVGETTQVQFACTKDAGPASFDEHSLFEIGSITKGFTGLLLADMVRKGEVSLDDPASKHARAGAKLPSRAGEPITLRDLVTQSSGLPRLPPRFNPVDPRDPYADFTEDRLYESLAATEIGPDAKYAYSNFGFMWLTDLIARRGGKSYEALLKERILDPLGMRETAITLTPEQHKRFVQGHRTTYQPAPHWNFARNMEGVGGLRSSLADMLKLARAMAGREETPLKETIALAVQPVRSAGGIYSVGFAWHMYARGDTRVQFHDGGTGGFRSMIAVSPSARTGAVVLVDSEVSFGDLAEHLVDPAVPLAKKRVALPTGLETLKEYVGRYEITPAFAIEFFLDGERFMTQATGQQPIPVLREGPDAFYLALVPAKLRFSRGAEGQVDGVTLLQNGRETKGKRVPSAR